jgi:Raf kinase inhibitor-like YbhB/YbcL family protein
MVTVGSLVITSRSFQPDQPIPAEFSAEGIGARPILEISGAPDGTAELAVICHDPDAPMPNGFTHWTIYGLPPNTTEVGEQEIGREGPNSLGETGYTGPNPPPGHGPHRYYFWVYALDTAVDGTPSRENFLSQYAGNIIEQNRVVGTYERS